MTSLSEGKLSILLVDDDPSTLELLDYILSQKMPFKIIKTHYPTRALQLSQEYFFDAILIDVSFEYQGSPFGGLELYSQMLPRYGKSSLLAYSQVINDDLLKRYNFNFNFISKGPDHIEFATRLGQKSNHCVIVKAVLLPCLLILLTINFISN